MDIYSIIIDTVGYLMLWAAATSWRNKESEIKWFSWKWVIIFVLITVGANLVNLK